MKLLSKVSTKISSIRGFFHIIFSAGNWYGTDSHYAEYKQDYIKLYVDTIKTIVNQEDPRRPFLVSSPGNGKASEEEGYIAEYPYDSKYGDTHFYNYRDNNWDWRIYPKTR